MSRYLILVAKPSPNALEPVGIRLQERGYTLSVVPSADEALQLTQSKAPAAVLVDIATPELNGVQACGSLRKALNGTTTIVALNQGETALRQAALLAGADLVLEEPINWADLCAWLHTPRTPNGRLLAEGPLFGQTIADTIGASSLLSHDLKSPISVIISSLEVMLSFQEEDGTPESTRRLMEGALHAAYRQLNLVSTLVDLPRLELGCYDLQTTLLDFSQVVRDGLEKESYNLSTKGLDVAVDLPDTPLMVQADYELLQRVMSSLIDNVMKFTVRSDKLRISATHENESVVLRMTDTGRPIQPGFEQEIMHRASQWERRQAGARTSVALGLPFVYAVAKAHAGDFTAGSTPNGRFTTFTFSLPAV